MKVWKMFTCLAICSLALSFVWEESFAIEYSNDNKVMSENSNNKTVKEDSKLDDSTQIVVTETKNESVYYNGTWIELPMKNVEELSVPYIDESNQHVIGNTLKQTSGMERAVIPTIHPADKTRPRIDFIDVSSHQGNLSKSDYENMKKYGIRGVVVKLTEGTTYRNPNATNQIANAKEAGLKVSAYHYSWFTSKKQAEDEADFFASVAKQLGLSSDTIMVNDAEQWQINNGLTNANSIYFALRLANTHNYPSVIHYASASWFSGGILNQNQLGNKSTWVAQYLYDPKANNLLHQNTSGWQWTSKVVFPEITGKFFDGNIDYAGYFINSSLVPPIIEEPTGKITITKINGKEDQMLLTYIPIKGANNTKNVYFPVWSDKQQKDIVWYSAKLQSDGKWTVTVPITNHKRSGIYQVHNYVENYSGVRRLNSSNTFSISQPKVAKIDYVPVNKSQFKINVKIDSAYSNVISVKVPIWSKPNQSDIKWYEASKNGDSWIAKFDVRNHGNNAGKYNVHVYAYTNNGLTASGKLSQMIEVESSNEIDMLRLYNPNSGEHLYTSSVKEKDNLVRIGWKYEGLAWKAPNKGVSVYRLYNPNNGDHHYTTGKKEKDNLVKIGWRYEGVAWYSGGETKILRLFNPNQKGPGAHHYTRGENEKNNLVRIGWRYEGIGWLGL